MIKSVDNNEISSRSCDNAKKVPNKLGPLKSQKLNSQSHDLRPILPWLKFNISRDKISVTSSPASSKDKLSGTPSPASKKLENKTMFDYFRPQEPVDLSTSDVNVPNLTSSLAYCKPNPRQSNLPSILLQAPCHPRNLSAPKSTKNSLTYFFKSPFSKPVPSEESITISTIRLHDNSAHEVVPTPVYKMHKHLSLTTSNGNAITPHLSGYIQSP